MSILVVTQGKDGRGKIQPFSDGKNHAGESFFVAGRELYVQKDNRIYIPRSIFNEIKSNKIVIQTGATYEEGEKIQGANVLQSKSIEKYIKNKKTGQRVPKHIAGEHARGKGQMNILEARDGTYIYTG